MSTNETKNINLDLKNLNEDGTFEGLLSVYGVVDEYLDIVEPGAYAKTLKDNSARVPLLWQHNQESPIGELELTDGQVGLQAKGTILLSDDVPDGKKAYALLKAGLVKGLSIGYRAIRSKMDGKIRRLKEVKLFEGSLVTIPANRFALVQSVKRLNLSAKDFDSELEVLQLHDLGYQILSALRLALYKGSHDPEMSNEQKVDAAAQAIEQFRAAYLEFLPRYLEVDTDTGYMSADDLIERMKQAPDPIRDLLIDFSTKILETETHPGTSKDAAGAAPPIPDSTLDSEALRSWATDLSKRWAS